MNVWNSGFAAYDLWMSSFSKRYKPFLLLTLDNTVYMPLLWLIEYIAMDQSSVCSLTNGYITGA
jgi:hypothetical protein